MPPGKPPETPSEKNFAEEIHSRRGRRRAAAANPLRPPFGEPRTPPSSHPRSSPTGGQRDSPPAARPAAGWVSHPLESAAFARRTAPRRLLRYPERLGGYGLAVEEDLDLVVTGGQALGLDDVELGGGVGGRRDGLGLVANRLLGAATRDGGPARGELGGGRAAGGADHGVDGVAGREGVDFGDDLVVGTEGLADREGDHLERHGGRLGGRRSGGRGCRRCGTRRRRASLGRRLVLVTSGQ